jgi:hypothetical protein
MRQLILMLVLTAIIGCKKDSNKAKSSTKTQNEHSISAEIDDKTLAEENARKKPLHASITVVGSSLMIRNNSKEDWRDLSVFINGPPNAYEMRISMRAGQARLIPLKEFSKPDGERFNDDRYKVRSVIIGGGDFQMQEFGQ